MDYSINTMNGTLKNINTKNNSKKKIVRTKALALTASAIILVSTLTGCGININKEVVIPEDQILIEVPYEIDTGDSLGEITNMFFTDGCEGVYSFREYQELIRIKNQLPNGDHIETSETLTVPIIVSKDNEYYLKIQEIENQIRKIEKENLWVEYTVESGDSLSSLAALASGSYKETYNILDEIRSRNHFSSPVLQEGQVIFIMNPELGDLKIQLESVKEEFGKSFSTEKQKSY